MWDDEERRTIRYTATGRWTWDEFYGALEEAQVMMDGSPHTSIDFIVDMRRGNLLPSNALSHFGRLSTHSHPKSGVVVLCGTNAFVKALVNALGKVNGGLLVNLRVSEDLEEARRILTERRDQPTLTR